MWSSNWERHYNNIRFADDTVTKAEIVEYFQLLIDRVTRECFNNGLNTSKPRTNSINTSKTMLLVFVVSKQDVGPMQLIVNRYPVKIAPSKKLPQNSPDIISLTQNSSDQIACRQNSRGIIDRRQNSPDKIVPTKTLPSEFIMK
uniref:Uncharacterized protein LOC114328454 n=1 Tax=Diabrotica virgifera virgifera TaxID=50390 RepID=A0A6P7FBW8_DIAVI